MTRLNLTVTGMNCTGCEARIATVLARVDGVSHVAADHAAGTVVIDYDPATVEATAITERLADAGYALAQAPR